MEMKKTKIIGIVSLDNGSLKLDDKVTISKEAASMGGSQIFLQEGEVYTVHDLLKGIAISSGNDVVVTKKHSQVISGEITI